MTELGLRSHRPCFRLHACDTVTASDRL